MARSVVTAGMLEDLRRSGAEIRLCRAALLTPAARDWLRDHRLPVTWLDEDGSAGGRHSLVVVMDTSLPEMRALRAVLDRMNGGVTELIEPVGGRNGIAAATRRLCGRIARKEVAKGVVFAPEGAVPVCIANKHVGVRAVLGTSLASVEEACRELGVNVLVVEYPRQTTWQLKQMIDRLVTGPTAARAETGAMIESIEAAGGRAEW